jgi:predicted DNA binding protein
MIQLGMTRSVMFKMFKECDISLKEDTRQDLIASRWSDHTPVQNNKKVCSICKEQLPLDMFHKSKSALTGLAYQCINCLKEIYKNNPEKVKKRSNEYKKNNPEINKVYYHNYYLKNHETVAERAKLWAVNNPEKAKESRRKTQKKHQKERNARTAAYRASKKQAVPKWANLEKINEFFKNCPEGYHVDHIYPIRSDFVCGLHVIENLRYIPELENESKSNAIIDPDFKVGVCHQYKVRQNTVEEDQKAGFNFDLKCKEFSLQQEDFTYEHRAFIEKYEWLGTIGYSPKWVFTARYNNSLAGVVLIGQPTANMSGIDIKIQGQVTRGACASWAPKHLNSKLVMFAINWCVKNTEKRVFFAYSDHEAGEIGIPTECC